jgi:predicted nucleic acid-binding protein
MRVEALPDPLVVDASVALKWVVDEPGSDAAFSLVAGQTLVTSALFWAEAANGLASKERRGARRDA